MTEHDPVALDVEEWANYWVSLKVDAVLVSVTGILCLLSDESAVSSEGEISRRSGFFWRMFAAAKKRGLHVIARMSPDLQLGRCG